MIGNDIVDLKVAKAQSNWQRPRFLSKLFSEEEQETIFSSEDKFVMVWRLWSMKEAAYKAHQREFNLTPKFNPKDFECTLISSEAGKVSIGPSEYKTFTKMTLDYIYSEAIKGKENLKTMTSNIKKEIPLGFYNDGLLKHISQKLHKSVSKLKIKKCTNQIPRVYLNNEEIKFLFSKTHHGKYSAYITVSVR